MIMIICMYRQQLGAVPPDPPQDRLYSSVQNLPFGNPAYAPDNRKTFTLVTLQKWCIDSALRNFSAGTVQRKFEGENFDEMLQIRQNFPHQSSHDQFKMAIQNGHLSKFYSSIFVIWTIRQNFPPSEIYAIRYMSCSKLQPRNIHCLRQLCSLVNQTIFAYRLEITSARSEMGLVNCLYLFVWRIDNLSIANWHHRGDDWTIQVIINHTKNHVGRKASVHHHLCEPINNRQTLDSLADPF